MYFIFLTMFFKVASVLGPSVLLKSSLKVSVMVVSYSFIRKIQLGTRYHKCLLTAFTYFFRKLSLIKMKTNYSNKITRVSIPFLPYEQHALSSSSRLLSPRQSVVSSHKEGISPEISLLVSPLSVNCA